MISSATGKQARVTNFGLNNKHVLHIYLQWEGCVCLTHCLKGLEDAVEEKVPDDFPVFKGGDIPDEEIGKHSQRGRQHDPSDGQRRGTRTTTTT